MRTFVRDAQTRTAFSDEWALGTRQTAAFLIGLSLYWPFFRRFGFLSFFSAYNDPSSSMWSAFSGIMFCLVLLYLGSALARRRIEPLIPLRRKTVAAIAIASSLGYAVLLLAPLMGGAVTLAMGVGDLLLACGYAALTFAWMWVASRCKGWTLFNNMLLSYLISTVYPFISYAPETVARTFLIATPILSGIAWYLCSDVTTWSASETSGADGSDGTAGNIETDYSLGSLKRLPLGFVIVFGLFLLAGSILVGLMHFSSESVSVVHRSVSAAVAAMLMVGLIAASWNVRRTRRLIQAGWTILAVIFFIGMLGILASPNELGGFGASLIEACLGCFELFLWYLLLVGVFEQRLSILLVFGLGFALFKVGPNYLGKYVVPNAMAASGVGGEVVDLFVIGMMALLLIVSFLFLGRGVYARSDQGALLGENSERTPRVDGLDMHVGIASDPSSAIPNGRLTGIGVSGTDGFEKAIGHLAAERGLTPRETDVMELMSRGYSYQAIADQLFLSLGTVQWHTKNVYRKLDVHTKQEVINLVRSTMTGVGQ